MPSALTIAPADAAGVATIVEWAAAEGWNPGLHDAAAFHAADPGGFLLGSIDGEAVAAISVVRHDDAFAFLGLYIVRPTWRGRGHGLAMWHAGSTLAGDRTVGLDGVVARQDDYRRSGFTLVRRNVRYGGRGGGTSASTPHDDLGLTPLADVRLAAIRAYDAGIFPSRRDRYLDAWLAMPDSHGLAAVDDDGRLVGYGIARPCRVGVKIGPLFADDPEIAERLYRRLAAWTGDRELFLDVPETSAAGVALAERHGLTPVFETARMYARGLPDERVERIFGVTTFELG